MKSINQFILPLFVFIISISACKKDFLNAKPSTTIVAPTNLTDLQLLLENVDILNFISPGLPMMGADEYVFLDFANWQSTSTATERNSYVWAKDIFSGETSGKDWNAGYTAIFYCNNILETLNTIDKGKSNIKVYNTIKGWALFVRAKALFDLATCFSPAYDQNTASSDLGLPIRIKPGIDETVPRSSVKDTYNQVLSDLNGAKTMLGAEMPVNRNRPSKPAAFALLSRVYLNMREYALAETYADSTLSLYNTLIDYNTLDKTSTNPFTYNNDETIYSSATNSSPYRTILPTTINGRTTVNPELIALYNDHDLRLNIFFKTNIRTGNLYFNRGYVPIIRAFTGLATDEIFLTKAECLARRNQVSSAMATLNTLLKMRFSPTDFSYLTASDQTDALNKILLERRKELVWRSLRWLDLKRLNKEGADITITRVLDGQTYTLPPNDPRYVFPIPDDEITRSKILQNNR